VIGHHCRARVYRQEMGVGEVIDITFDFRPARRLDEIRTLAVQHSGDHQLLWSKPLPSGALFELDFTPPHYLHHRSELGEFGLSSDAVIPSFSRARELKHIMDQVPQVETDAFNRIGYTIGGMMVFPGYKVDGKMTINQRRGCHGRIRDRFDLTLECVRRHYLDEPSPLKRHARPVRRLLRTVR
jgi:hypothetical protein